MSFALCTGVVPDGFPSLPTGFTHVPCTKILLASGTAVLPDGNTPLPCAKTPLALCTGVMPDDLPSLPIGFTPAPCANTPFEHQTGGKSYSFDAE
jgi:hypothetical protein